MLSITNQWMNEYGATEEWYWQGKTEVLGEKHYTAWVVDGWMSMEQWWNDSDRGKLKYLDDNLSQCHLVHHKFHTDWPRIEPRPPQWPVSSQPPAQPSYCFLTCSIKNSVKILLSPRSTEPYIFVYLLMLSVSQTARHQTTCVERRLGLFHTYIVDLNPICGAIVDGI